MRPSVFSTSEPCTSEPSAIFFIVASIMTVERLDSTAADASVSEWAIRLESPP
jgi:hypothetical protein